MLWDVLSWCVFGFLAGAVSRLLVPGSDASGCLGTIVIGIAGSVVGGFLTKLLFAPPGADFHPSGFIGAVIGGIIVLVVLRRLNRPPAVRQ